MFPPLLLLPFLLALTSASCPQFWIDAGTGSCYKASPDRMNWNQADQVYGVHDGSTHGRRFFTAPPEYFFQGVHIKKGSLFFPLRMGGLIRHRKK